MRKGIFAVLLIVAGLAGSLFLVDRLALPPPIQASPVAPVYGVDDSDGGHRMGVYVNDMGKIRPATATERKMIDAFYRLRRKLSFRHGVSTPPPVPLETP